MGFQAEEQTLPNGRTNFAQRENKLCPAEEYTLLSGRTYFSVRANILFCTEKRISPSDKVLLTVF
jgi:hypothetical protein